MMASQIVARLVLICLFLYLLALITTRWYKKNVGIYFLLRNKVVCLPLLNVAFFFGKQHVLSAEFKEQNV